MASAGPEQGPRPRATWLQALVPAVTLSGLLVAGLLVVLSGYVAGGLALAGTCWVLAALRMLLRERSGTLAVRRPLLDAGVLLGLGTAVAVLTTSVPTP